MPMVYSLSTTMLATVFTTSATPPTTIEHQFIKPGTRNIALLSLLGSGRGAGLTALTGISVRILKSTTTSASGGTPQTPTPSDIGMQASKATAGMSATTDVTLGTGGPVAIGHIGFGGSSAGGWVAENSDAKPVLEGSDNKSFGFRSVSGTASMNFEITTRFEE